MLDTILDWLGAVLVVFFIVALAVGLVVGTIYAIAPAKCNADTADIGLEHRWSFWGRCQVQIEDGRWVPLDNWYYIEKKGQP